VIVTTSVRLSWVDSAVLTSASVLVCTFKPEFSVTHLFIRPPPFRIAICSSLAPDLPGLQWTAGGSQLGATLKVIVIIRPKPVSGALGVIAARFLVQIGASANKPEGSTAEAVSSGKALTASREKIRFRLHANGWKLLEHAGGRRDEEWEWRC
jgi:hypothetical protein